MSALFLAPMILLGTVSTTISGTVAIFPIHDQAGKQVSADSAASSEFVKRLTIAVNKVSAATALDAKKVGEALAQFAKRGRFCTTAACYARIGQFIGAEFVMVAVQKEAVNWLWAIDVDAEALLRESSFASDLSGLNEAIKVVVNDEKAKPSTAPSRKQDSTTEPLADPAELALDTVKPKTVGSELPADGETKPHDEPPDEDLPPLAETAPRSQDRDAPANASLRQDEGGSLDGGNSAHPPAASVAQASTTESSFLFGWLSLGGFALSTVAVVSLVGVSTASLFLLRFGDRAEVTFENRRLGSTISDVAGGTAIAVALLGGTASTALLVWQFVGAE